MTANNPDKDKETLWFGFSSNKKLFENLGKKVDKILHIAGFSIGTVVIAFVSIHLSNYTLENEYEKVENAKDFFTFLFSCPWLYFLVGAIFMLFGGLGISKDHAALKKEIAELEASKKTLETSLYNEERKSTLHSENFERESERFFLLEGEIAAMHAELVRQWLISVPINKDHKSYCRVSLYYYSEESFTLLSRYSENPFYSRLHKQKFPQNEGAISKAWQHGEWLDNECPEHSKDEEGYLRHHKEIYNFEKEKAAAFTMKSCRILALAIKDIGTRIGVIVFESNKPDILNARNIKAIKDHCTKHESNIASFIKQGIMYDLTIRRQRASSVQSDDSDILKSLGSAA